MTTRWPAKKAGSLAKNSEVKDLLKQMKGCIEAVQKQVGEWGKKSTRSPPRNTPRWPGR